jgi:lipoyl(octanoyl) transferase
VLFDESVAKKLEQRDQPDSAVPNNYFLYVEHPHVYTLGKSGSLDNLLLDETGLEKKEATFYKINRGGDITYHGPGQVVGYPILDLDQFSPDIHLYLRNIEEAVIRLCADYGIKGERFEKYTGVWIEPGTPQERKICAIGVKTSRWVSMHGFALNVNTNLDYFGNIVPCGIVNKDVTSLQRELGREMDMAEVKQKLLAHFGKIFKMEFVPFSE